MDYLYGLLFFVLGLITGKLLNFLADITTVEEGGHITTIYCPVCGVRRPKAALLPLTGFFRLVTRCGKCLNPLTLRVPIVELCTGTIFAYLFIRYGWSAELPTLIVFCSIFITLFITDMEHTLLPNSITYMGMVVALAIAGTVTLLNLHLLWAFQFPTTGWLSWLNIYMINVVLASLLGFLLFFLIALASRGGMGFGDVKLAALMGLAMGLPALLVALFLGIVAGGMVAGVLLITGIKKRREAIPFGPFLCLGGISGLLWGKELLAWYLNLI